MFKNNPGGYFYGEMSLFNREDYKPLSGEQIMNMFIEKAKNKNFWENVRIGNINLPKEDWI